MKILPTIGPVTEKTNNLKYLFNYCSMVRFNSSHNKISWHKKIINKVKKINNKIDILVDIPGVKPRTNNKNEIKIKKNQIVFFGYNLKQKNEYYINLTRKLPKKKGRASRLFSLDDGKILFKIVKFNNKFISGKAMHDCVIQPKKGLNIPNSVYDNVEQKNIYIEYLNKFKKTNINAVGLSFVQNKDLIIFLKKKFSKLLMVSKIENSEGLKNADEICKCSDAIMIDRGDLSAEIGDDNLYEAILKISSLTKKYGKPLIMATENLETMSKSNKPSKNDIISLEFSNQINSDAIMLSEETAISNRWKYIIIWLNKFLISKKTKLFHKFDNDIFWEIVDLIKDRTLVVFTKKGLMLDKVFKKSTKNDVFVFTDTPKTKSTSNFYKNAICFLTSKINNKNLNKYYYDNIKKYEKIIFKNTNQIILLTISFPRKGSKANTLSLIDKKDILG
jgi:pyruvate kinase